MLLGELDLNAAPATGALANLSASIGKPLVGLGGLGAAASAAAAPLAAFAAVAALVALPIAGLKDVLDFSGELADLSANTGVAVDELVILRQAFANTGVGAEQMGKLLTKANITSIADIERLSEKYRGLASQQEKNALLAGTFGRGGYQLGAMLGDAGALSFAREQAGPLADVMARNVETFDRLGDVMGGLKNNFQEFFAGALDRIAPEALHIADALSNINFVGLGQGFGVIAESVLKLGDAFVAIAPSVNFLSDLLSETFGSEQAQGALATKYQGFAKLMQDERGDGDRSIVGGLQKVGGGGIAFGGGGDVMLSESRRQSSLLEQIRDRLDRGERLSSTLDPVPV